MKLLTLISVLFCLFDRARSFSIASNSPWSHLTSISNRFYQSRRPQTRCFAEKKGGTARFRGIDESGGATNALDYALSLLVSDIGSIILGVIGLAIVVGHRLGAMDELVSDTMGQETRSDLLATFASLAVLLNGISKLDVTSALAESVQLDGLQLQDDAEINSNVLSAKDLRWSLESLLKATPAKSVVILVVDDDGVWKILACAGIVPRDESLRRRLSLTSVPILDRFRKDQSKESYLPTLQALPGKSEFTYLPVNTQGALLLPVKGDPVTVLVLGLDTAKSFTPRDVAWSRVVAERIGLFLN